MGISMPCAVEAILPGLAAYLGLPPERRNESPEDTAVPAAMRYSNSI
jgi:hypothetical protein